MKYQVLVRVICITNSSRCFLALVWIMALAATYSIIKSLNTVCQCYIVYACLLLQFFHNLLSQSKEVGALNQCYALRRANWLNLIFPTWMPWHNKELMYTKRLSSQIGCSTMAYYCHFHLVWSINSIFFNIIWCNWSINYY